LRELEDQRVEALRRADVRDVEEMKLPRLRSKRPYGSTEQMDEELARLGL